MSEWITNRLPTKEDSFANQVIIAWDDGSMCMTDYKHVEEGMPWTSIPKPEPYVKPEPERWKPKAYECYWTVDNFAVFNYFQTQEQAEEAARRVRETLLNYHEELLNE